MSEHPMACLLIDVFCDHPIDCPSKIKFFPGLEKKVKTNQDIAHLSLYPLICLSRPVQTRRHTVNTCLQQIVVVDDLEMARLSLMLLHHVFATEGRKLNDSFGMNYGLVELETSVSIKRIVPVQVEKV